MTHRPALIARPRTGRVLARATALALLWVAGRLALADGMPEDLTATATAAGTAPAASGPATTPTGAARGRARTAARPAGQRDTVPAAAPARDPLSVDPAVSVRDEPLPALDLPGVLRLDGADAGLLDPTRVREIHWRNRGIVTVWVSAHQVNRIQLPFANPRVVTTDAIAIQKRAASNNVYVHFERDPVAEVVWFEPPAESSVAIGLQLVPKRIPAQDIVVLDDTAQGSAGPAARARRAGADQDHLTRVQALMELAGLGASPPGFAEAELQLPPLAVNGLAVNGLRRLSSRSEDLYVYELVNPTPRPREVQEEEFDGDDVLAVSILPRPRLDAGERAVLVVLARKRSDERGVAR